MFSIKGAFGASAAIGSWMAAYYFIVGEIDKSSSLVKQTIFNINANQENHVKTVEYPVKITSSIRGKMNQFKGLADIEFDVVDKLNSNNGNFCFEK